MEGTESDSGVEVPRVLTVRQPWAWAIIHAGKDVENRSWRTNHRGLLLIHAGQRFDPAGEAFIRELGLNLTEAARITGRIIGSVDVADVVRDYDSVWAMSDLWNWVLVSKAPAVRPLECKGRLSLFAAPPEWVTAFA